MPQLTGLSSLWLSRLELGGVGHADKKILHADVCFRFVFVDEVLGL